MFKKIVWLSFVSKWKNIKNVEKYIQSLIKNGADEFFTWYNPKDWSDKFGFEVSPNWRFAEHEQITDIEILKGVTNEIHKNDLEIFVNLNAWYYTDVTMPQVKNMVKEFEDIWVDWIICWNISILEYLKNIWYSGKINLSTIFSLYNIESIKFFIENYDINKIILSRELTLKEIENIVLTFPETKFEVFWEWDFCRYNNGLCFAEHKYWVKDICTVVVRDLVVRKKFRPDFKSIILNENLKNIEKIEVMNDEYLSIFEEIEKMISSLGCFFTKYDENEKIQKLFEVLYSNKNRVDLFYDALKPINNLHNSNVITFLKWLNYYLSSQFTDNKYKNELEELKKELEESIESWLKFNVKKEEELWWQTKLKAFELSNFYAKGDSLNLYNYIYFSKFKNIETVKFPTRWRNYNEKIKIITDVVKNKDSVLKKYINRWSSLERIHYDLSYLFWDKLWFRKYLQDL